MTIFTEKVRLNPACQKLTGYVRKQNYLGYDPFDGLNSRVFRALQLHRVPFFRLCWLQLFKRSPWNFRGFTLTPKGFNAKGGALFISGYVELYRLTGEESYKTECMDLFKRLKEIKIERNQGSGWGYNFDWQAKAFYVPEGTPNVVTSVFVGHALLDMYETFKIEECQTLAFEIRAFILAELINFENDKELCFAYIPGKKAQVHNANLLASAFLARLAQGASDPRTLEVIEKSVNFSTKDIQPDYSWPYGTMAHHRWVDNFHTGYNLEALMMIRSLTGDKCDETIRNVFDYYVNKLFDEQGRPKYYSHKTYPIDTHTIAEAIILFSRVLKDETAPFNEEQKSKARKRINDLVLYATQKMQRSNGSFYYQRTKRSVNKISYMRWTQAWMFKALCLYETVEPESDEKKVPPTRKKFFGANVDALTMEETLQEVDRIIESREVTQHVVINVAKLVAMQNDESLKQIVNDCPLINADGQGIVWGAKLLGVEIPERVAGIDLFTNIVERAAAKGYKLYFLGAKQEVVERVVHTFKTKYPTLKIAGYRNGYFRAEEEDQIAEDIRDSGADVLFVAMGSPKKEFFLGTYTQTMQVPFVMGVGGSFDVIAGVTKRAPLWMQKAGLEWFYRFLCEPGRMWKRYLTTNVKFLGMLMKAKLTGKQE